MAVTETYAFDEGVGVGDRIRMRSTGSPSGRAWWPSSRTPRTSTPSVLVSAALVGERSRTRFPSWSSSTPPTADVRALLAGTGATVLTADAWIDQVEAQTRAGNNLGLWVLLGPAGLYAGIAIVNAVLIGASQRRTQLRTVGLLGADRATSVAGWRCGRPAWSVWPRCSSARR